MEGNNHKSNLQIDGLEITVYYSLTLQLEHGVCRFCGGKPKQLFWSIVEIEEIIGPTGDNLPIDGRVATIAKRRITSSSGVDIRGCEAHYKEEVPAYL